ncbi:hypothetical protein GCM10025867_45080 [Frondihabitans sucicola]|uniref:Major facilitator superfamily (MFS) profile domain-containing protein n=1 Tax=Frondihabitans sucicola TaxID=1268041 RepID=A0ABN6XS54_9MICO|nr:MFS transporter [Frondihabitans sucicola]BDZ47794.1 hypothetical protein GCM10025867_00350 [Frondihabitans sucicola]BDZ52267.1 hypothetical protein GCM10025867_45080 [Frondihabitans sucicola]
MVTPTSSDFSLRSIAFAAYAPSVLFGLSQGAMLPVIAISSIERGADEAVASLVVAMIGIGSLVTNIPAGAVTTRFGERRSMVGAAALSAVGLALCLLPLGLIVFTLGVLLVGAASSVFLLARQSYLTEAVPAEQRARALSTLGGVQRIGVFIGPFASAGLIRLAGIDGAYLLALVAIAGAGVIAYTVPDLVQDPPLPASGRLASRPSRCSATTGAPSPSWVRASCCSPRSARPGRWSSRSGRTTSGSTRASRRSSTASRALSTPPCSTRRAT